MHMLLTFVMCAASEPFNKFYVPAIACQGH